jgi:ABC-2 type transport system permease protein
VSVLEPRQSTQPRASGLVRTWRKARVMFNAWFSHMTAYRAELVIWMLVGSLPLIMMAVWIGKAQANGGTLQGFKPEGFAAYFLATWLAQQFTVAWVAWELDFQIRQGNLSIKLLRPLDPFWEFLAQHVTERFVRGPMVLFFVILGTLMVRGTVLTPSVGHAVVFLLAITLAFLVRFLIAYCIGLMCFWLESATALDEFYWILSVMLGGGFAPLEFYPAWLQTVINWTPFPWIVYYPVKVLTGTLPWPQIAQVIGVQLLWVIGFAALRHVMWKAGLKKYGAVGA